MSFFFQGSGRRVLEIALAVSILNMIVIRMVYQPENKLYLRIICVLISCLQPPHKHTLALDISKHAHSAHMHTQVHIYTHTHTHTYTHVYTYTRTPSRTPRGISDNHRDQTDKCPQSRPQAWRDGKHASRQRTYMSIEHSSSAERRHVVGVKAKDAAIRKPAQQLRCAK